MAQEPLFPLIATIVSAVFGAAVLLQWWGRRKPYQLLWALGLFVFAAATFLEYSSDLWGWSPGSFKLYYVLGAFNVGLLGSGTVYLLKSRRNAHIFLGVILAVAAVTGILSIGAAVDESLLAPGKVDPDAMASPVRIAAAPMPILGGIALIGGAFYSAYRTKTFYNVLIGLGGLAVALGGVSAVAGNPAYLFLSELVGVSLMFAGFLRSVEILAARKAVPEPAKG